MSINFIVRLIVCLLLIIVGGAMAIMSGVLFGEAADIGTMPALGTILAVIGLIILLTGAASLVSLLIFGELYE